MQDQGESSTSMRIIVEFTYNLSIEKFKIRTQVTASASGGSDHLYQPPMVWSILLTETLILIYLFILIN